jgi:hypothetical protein
MLKTARSEVGPGEAAEEGVGADVVAEMAAKVKSTPASRKLTTGPARATRSSTLGAHVALLELGDAADREEEDLAGLDAVLAGGEGVAELVRDHGGEHGEHEDDAVERIEEGAAAAVAAHAGPQEEQQEGGVDAGVDAEESAEVPGPGHGRSG